MKTYFADTIHNFSIGKLMDRLVTSSRGRVALHTLCLFRHPGHFSWHWHGIVREFGH